MRKEDLSEELAVRQFMTNHDIPKFDRSITTSYRFYRNVIKEECNPRTKNDTARFAYKKYVT